MPQATFPDPDPDPIGSDDAEPGGFPLDQDGPGPEQGLYISLPAGHLDLDGFNQGGAADTMTPGPLAGHGRAHRHRAGRRGPGGLLG